MEDQINSDSKAINSQGNGAPRSQTMQSGLDAAKQAEDERGGGLDQPSLGPPPRASDEQDGLDYGPELPIPAIWVPPVAAGVSLSFAHEGGTGCRGTSSGTRFLPFPPNSTSFFCQHTSSDQPKCAIGLLKFSWDDDVEHGN
eukprot:11748694-Ditylum_brightwellii.AAC.1